jgi:hypothetical protein
MNPIGYNQFPLSSAVPAAATKTRALQRIKPANDLYADVGENPDRGTHFSRDQRGNGLYRFATDRAVPFRYGTEAPRLSSAFAAQMLGQMMPDPERRNCDALAAYEESPATALLCDRQM